MRTNFHLILQFDPTYTAPPWAVLIAGAFVILTLCLSLYLVFEHLSTYKNPEEQKFLIGVILMVPFYSIESFVSLMKPSISIDIEILRDCYESFAMYCFSRYLVACLGGEERTVEFLEMEGGGATRMPLLEPGSEKGIVKHHFPMNLFFKPWKLGQWLYQVIKIGIVQYMIIKALTAIIAVILESYDVYCDGDFKLNCGYPYMAVVLNFSQTWALYCLVQFYTVAKDRLAHIQPLAKFLTFKSIVFLTWWQGIAIAILYDLGLFKSPIAQALQFKSSVQDFIICIEVLMVLIGRSLLVVASFDPSCFASKKGQSLCGTVQYRCVTIVYVQPVQMGIASVVHLYVFPAKPYELMGDRISGTVAVLGEYVSADCPVDPDEVRDSERPTKLRLPQPDLSSKSGMTFGQSVRDVFLGGGGYIVEDLKFTVNHTVEPMEKGITKFNEKLHEISQNIKKRDKDKRQTKDDSCITSPPPKRVIRGIDDPLLIGSISDSGASRGRKQKHRQKLGYTSESGESSSDQSYGGYMIHGRRWVVKE